jgi:LCP family protein required for cell wall assembly
LTPTGVLAAVIAATLLPGWTTFPRHRGLAVVLALAGVGAPLGLVGYWVFGGRNWVALTLDTGFLAWAAIVVVFALVARLVAVAETWAALRGTPRLPRDRWALPIAGAVCIALGFTAVSVVNAREDLDPVFTPTEGDLPLFDADRPDPTTPSGTAVDSTLFHSDPDGPAPDPDLPTVTAPPKPAKPESGVDPAVVADVRNVLLLGGDAGPDRGGLRTDTMMLFSIHVPSGRASLVSIPRDLSNLLFPPGSELEARFPYGWDDLANAIYPKVSADEELRAAYDVEGVRPGVVALAESIGYSLDVTIDDYVLVDMQGFLELIDAIGGVTVNVTKEIPMPGNVPGAPTEYPDTIGPGLIHMDGTTALGYVRSRKGDSDYQRARRQRDLLAALATQVDVRSVVRRFPSIASAVGGTVRTSLTTDELSNILAVIGGETAIVESVGLVPPLVDVTAPDYQELAEIVGAVRVALATGVPSGY